MAMDSLCRKGRREGIRTKLANQKRAEGEEVVGGCASKSLTLVAAPELLNPRRAAARRARMSPAWVG
jgi:hypothetical protein